MTRDQLEHANKIYRSMVEHKKIADGMNVDGDPEPYHNMYGIDRFPDEINRSHNIQRRDWHKLRAYELAEEFAKL